MATGTVKWFNDSKGFGFITPTEGGEDLFAHHTAIQMNGFKTLKEGQKVEFEVKRGPKGLQRSEEHTSELQSPCNLVCRLLLEKKKENRQRLGQHVECTALEDSTWLFI